MQASECALWPGAGGAAETVLAAAGSIAQQQRMDSIKLQGQHGQSCLAGCCFETCLPARRLTLLHDALLPKNERCGLKTCSAAAPV